MPFETTELGIEHLRHQNLTMPPEEGNDFYLPLFGKRFASSNDTTDLAHLMQDFTNSANAKRVCTLFGDGGAGKSTFLKQFTLKLWQEHTLDKPIPLFISLPLLDNPIQNAIEETLTSEGFSESQIAELKARYSFVFILDGYDELHQLTNLYRSNHLSEWNAKTIISCRTQYLYNKRNADLYFMPFSSEREQPQLLQTYYVAPFNQSQIESYLETMRSRGVLIPDYEEIIRIPGLQEIITTPFLLHLVVEVLPEILASYQSENIEDRHRLTQTDLYKGFIERWFVRQEQKLKDSGHITADMPDQKLLFRQHCETIALIMHENNLTWLDSKDSRFSVFFKNTREAEQLRSACPLRIENGKLSFWHASLIIHLVGQRIYQEALGEGIESAHKTVVEMTTAATLHPIQERPVGEIHKRLITDNPDVLSQWSDDVERNSSYKAYLFDVIERSKINEYYTVGAANAISILNYARVSFSNMNFQGIRIPHANLENVSLHNTNLEESDLSYCILKNAFLVGANISKAKLVDVQFGEKSALSWSAGGVCSLCFSLDSQHLFVAGDGGDIVMQNVENGKIFKTFSGHKGRVLNVIISPDAQYLASSGEDKTVRYWEIATMKSNIVAHFKTDQPIASLPITFTPSGTIVYSSITVFGSDVREITPTLDESADIIHTIHIQNCPGIIRDIHYSFDQHWLALGRRTHLLPPLENNSILNGMNSSIFGSAGSLMSAAQQLLPNFSLALIPGIELLTGLQRAPGLESCEIRDTATYQVVKSIPADIFCFSQDNAQLAVSVFTLYTGVSYIEIYGIPDFQILYRFETNMPKNLLRGQFFGSITALQYSCAAGKRILASGSDSGNIYLWDALEFKSYPITRFEKHIAPVVSLSFSADQRFLASGTGNGHDDMGKASAGDQIVGVFEIQSQQHLQQRSHKHDGEIRSLEVSTIDGKIITAGSDGEIKFWSAHNGQYLGSYTAYAEERAKSILAMCLSEREFSVASQKRQSQQTIMTVSGGLPLNEGNKVKKFFLDNMKINRSDVLNLETELSGGVLNADGSMNYQAAMTLARENISVSSLSISPDGKRLAIGQLHKPVTIFDLETLQLICTYSEYAERLSFNLTGLLLAITHPGTLIRGMRETIPHCLSTLANTQLKGSLTSEGFLSVIDANTGDPIFTPVEKVYDGGQGERVLAFSPKDPDLFISISNQWSEQEKQGISFILFWNIARKEQVAAIRNHDSYTNCLSFSKNGRYLATGSCNKITLFDLEHQQFCCIVSLYTREFTVKNLIHELWGIHSLIFFDDLSFFTAEKNGSIHSWKIVDTQGSKNIELTWHNSYSLNVTHLNFNNTAQLSESYVFLFIKNGAKSKTTLDVALIERYHRGLEQFSNNQHEVALDFFNEVIEADLSFEEAYVKKGQALFALKRTVEAEQQFNFLISLPNQNTVVKRDAYYYRGIIFVNKKDFKRAVQDFQAAKYWAVKANSDTNFMNLLQVKYDEVVEALRLIKLFSACYLGYDFFAPLFQRTDANTPNPVDGGVLLDYALNINNEQIIELLLHSGANPALLNGNPVRTPFSSMLMRKQDQRDMKTIRRLVSANLDVISTLDADGMHPLFYAVASQDIILATYILTMLTIRINTPVSGITPLHKAIETLNVAMIALLLKHLANYQTLSNRMTPLAFATSLSIRSSISNEQKMRLEMIIVLLLTCYEYDRVIMPVNMTEQQKIIQRMLLNQETTKVREIDFERQTIEQEDEGANLCMSIVCCPCAVAVLAISCPFIVIAGALKACGFFKSEDSQAQNDAENQSPLHQSLIIERR